MDGKNIRSVGSLTNTIEFLARGLLTCNFPKFDYKVIWAGLDQSVERCRTTESERYRGFPKQDLNSE